METVKNVLSIIGGLLGAIAFFWGIFNALLSYLHIDLKVEQNDDLATALTSIDNKGSIPKQLHYAALLIGPENESVNDIAKTIVDELGSDASTYKDHLLALFNLRPEQSVVMADKSRALIPLPFFFLNQRQIGNETIKYRCSIDTARLERGKTYLVVFLVFIHYPFGFIRWRSTSDLLRTKLIP